MKSDLANLLAAADLYDPIERAMLADAYEEAGLPDDAAALRGDLAAQLADPPNIRRQTCRTLGYTHPDELGSSVAVEDQITVTAECWDLLGGRHDRWHTLSPSERVSVIEALEELWRARCDFWSAPPAARAWIKAEGVLDGSDPASEAREIWAAIKRWEESRG